MVDSWYGTGNSTSVGVMGIMGCGLFHVDSRLWVNRMELAGRLRNVQGHYLLNHLMNGLWAVRI